MEENLGANMDSNEPIAPSTSGESGHEHGRHGHIIHYLLPHRGNRGLYYTGLSLIIVGIFTIASVASYFRSDSDLLPSLKKHGDVQSQPLYTFAESLHQNLPGNISDTPNKCAPLSKNWLQIENQNPGVEMTSKDWKSVDLYTSGGSALWLDKDSVTCGDTIQVHAALTARYRNDEGPRTISIMRVGNYGGSGAREVWTSSPIDLVYRNTPNVRSLTRTVTTPWPTTFSFKIGSRWVPGLYLVASYSPSGVLENWSPFILRSPRNTSKLTLLHSTLTWQAYNNYGGRSAYTAPVEPLKERSKVVSFDRPYTGSGINHIDRDAISLVQYLESENIATDQITDVDLTTTPHLIDGYSGLILSGHPEYMTHTEFAAILAARNSGVNLALLGANSAYWQVRLENSKVGKNREFAIYRDATIDPQTSPDKLTVEFANKRINWPPSLITGEVTGGVHVYGNMKLVDKPRWLKVPANLSIDGWPGNTEIDSLTTGPAVPTNIHVLFSGKFKLEHPNARPNATKRRSLIADSIWFTHPSGSAEFVAGVNYWPCELSGNCVESGLVAKERNELRDITTQILHIWEHKAVGPMLDPTAYRNVKR